MKTEDCAKANSGNNRNKSVTEADKKEVSKIIQEKPLKRFLSALSKNYKRFALVLLRVCFWTVTNYFQVLAQELSVAKCQAESKSSEIFRIGKLFGICEVHFRMDRHVSCSGTR